MTTHIRAPSKVVKYTRSPAQQKRMKAFQTCSNWWSKNRTSDIFFAWTSFANDYETPYNAFLRLNIVRVFNDLPIAPTPPLEL